MPQIQVLDPVPTFGSELAKILGRAGGDYAKNVAQVYGDKKKDIKNEIGKIPTAQKYLNKEVLQGNLNALDPQTRLGLDKRAEQLLRAGKASNANDAAVLAYQEYQQKLNEQEQQNLKNNPTKSNVGKFYFGKDPEDVKENVLNLFKDAPETLLGGILKGVRPLVNLSDIGTNIGKLLTEGGAEIYDKLAGTPQEKIDERNAENKKKLEKIGFKTNTQRFDELTKGKGIPEGQLQEIIAGYPFGTSGIISKGAEVAAKNLGAPEWLQSALEFTTFLASEGTNLPKKLSNNITDLAKKVSAKTGQSVEEVIGKAQKTANVDFDKIIKGDTKEAAKLNNELSKELKSSLEKVKQTPKTVFNSKAAIEERELFGSKLPEQPLRDYYAEPKEIAVSKDISERLEPLIKTKENELNNAFSQLREVQARARNAQNMAEQQRWQSIANFQENSLIAKLQEELRDLKYEAKYGIKRPSETQLNAQVEKSINEMVDLAKNRSPENIKKFNRQLELDQKYLDSAQKILDRGEIPGEFRPDTFIQRKQKYLDAYEKKIKELKDQLPKLESEQLASTKEAIDFLEKRANRLKADIVNQSNKLKVMSKLKPPSAAFYKQGLKDAFKDIEEFQRDFFKDNTKRVLKNEGLKTKVTAKKKIESLGEELGKNPSRETAKKLLKEETPNARATKEDADKFKAELEKRAEKVEEGAKEAKEGFKEAAKQTEHGVEKKELYKKIYKGLKKVITHGVGVGAAIGVLQAFSEEYLHVKPNATLLRHILGATRITSLGAQGAVHDYFQSLFDEGYLKKMQELRNNPEKLNKYLREIEQNQGKGKVKRLQKKFQNQLKNS